MSAHPAARADESGDNPRTASAQARYQLLAHTDTARLLIRAAVGTSVTSDLDDLNIGHGVVIRILSHDRNTMGDGRSRDPAVVDRHLPTCRAKPRDQQRPSFGDGLVDGQRLEPLSELIARQPARASGSRPGSPPSRSSPSVIAEIPHSKSANLPTSNRAAFSPMKTDVSASARWVVITADRQSSRSEPRAVPPPAQRYQAPAGRARGRSPERPATVAAATAG